MEKPAYKGQEGDNLINIAVVDDEKVIREQIKKMLESRPPECQTDTYSTGEELLAAGKHYDMIFLDIQMEGMNGIDTAKVLREKQEAAVLIFITGMKEYVFDAFDVAAFHYLLKPIGEEKLASVYERAVLEVRKRKMQNQNRQNQSRLFVKTRNRSVALEQSNILYIESRAKKVEIHTKSEVMEVYAAISELERQLAWNFYRCHRGYLVNMAFIAEYDSGSITLSNGESVILAREKYGEFVKTYMRYLKNGGGILV